MINRENLELAKRYVKLVPDMPRDEPVETVNPGLADIFREAFLYDMREPLKITEAEAVQELDRVLIP
jgi:hypothetical protein